MSDPKNNAVAIKDGPALDEHDVVLKAPSRFKRKVKKEEFKLSEELAFDQVMGLIDYYEIDVDKLPEKQAQSVDPIFETLVTAVRRGRLEINIEDGITCTQTLRNGETIVYREINGKAKTAMGSKKDGDGNGRIYAVMGALSIGETAIVQLKGQDSGLVEALGAVFLLV